MPVRTVESFNLGFRFHRGPAPDEGATLSYERLKPWLLPTGRGLVSELRELPAPPETRAKGGVGSSVSFVQNAFDDSGWRQLDLPHDWGIEGPFDQSLPGETGKLPWQGVGWYRKRFTLPKKDRNRRVFLRVDGAMAYSAFWLNGVLIGGWPYGYSTFRLDLTPHVKFGEENVLAVRLDNPPNSSRWYPGSGLYRNLWLEKVPLLRIAPSGVFVTTPRVSRASAVVNVDVVVENDREKASAFEVRTSLHATDDNDEPVGDALATSSSGEVALPAARQTARTLCVKLRRPKLWSPKQPHRYVAVTSIEREGRVLDRVVTPFGVRSVQVDADEGFLLNGRRVTLNGVCMHHDLGCLGAAVNRRAMERQLEILKGLGCNAIRTSHNPPAPELLDLCDRMGMMVMDEAFDCWRTGKKWKEDEDPNEPDTVFFDYASVFDDWHEQDLRAMLRRDRNHPSIVMWSIGNEVMEQWRVDGWKVAQPLAGITREEDRSRPIVSAFNGESAGYSGYQTIVDVVGFNYKPGAYAPLHASNPTLPLLGAETSSCISTRGEYFFPVSDDPAGGRANFQVSSYDLYATPWAMPPDEEFEALDRCPYVMGEFVWTGFDYLGEPTPYNSDASNQLNFTEPAQRAQAARDLKRIGLIPVPSRSSYFGIVDLAGFPKDRYYLYQSRWRPDHRTAHILPHWTWPGREGEITPVMVYSAADEAELFLNGRSLGRRKRKRFQYRFRWDAVRYEPGELRVVTKKAGRRWAENSVHTTTPCEQIGLVADRTELRADGNDLAFVTVQLLDEAGRIDPHGNRKVEFSVQGPGEIVGVDNGDPTSLESFQAPQRHAFHGLALVVVKSHRGRKGRIRLYAEGEGLVAAQIELRSC